MKKEKAVLIFVKNPKLGYTKTRLAKTMGDEKALEIYKRLLTHTRDVVLEVEADLFVFYSDHIGEDDLWDKPKFNKLVQSEGDIGDKMHDGLSRVLESYKAAVLVGSDIAQLSPKVINTAFQILQDSDVALGPALDGGYYLIGMKSPEKSIFQLEKWSTADVLGDTLDKIMEAELTFNLTETLSDIDHEEDWNLYGLD